MRVFVIIVAYVLFNLANAFAQEEKSPWYEYYDVISYSELRALIEGGEIEEARILNDGWWVTVKKKDGEYLDVKITPQTPIADQFYDAGIPVRIEHSSKDEEDENPLWLDLLINLAPLLIFLVFLAFIVFAMRNANKKTANKYDDYLAKSGKAHEQHLQQIARLQNEFLVRLENILKEQKDSNG